MNWRAIASGGELADALVGLFAERGDEHYDEAVTQSAHAAQTARLARLYDAPSELTVAALLHDIGHLLEPDEASVRNIRDLRHEQLGARLLGRWYPPAVTEPIRLHVAAKRYLCAVDDTYQSALSPESARSLALQGGPMTATEAAAFASTPYADAATQLRHWDDLAKRTDVIAAPVASYRELLAGLSR